MSDPRLSFAGPPILPWFRIDSKKPAKAQLSKARVLKGAAIRPASLRGAIRFPDLRLEPQPAGARESRKGKKAGR